MVLNGFQLSLELTNVFGSALAAASVAKGLINFSRELRKSGSDIVVEEDLADIFGRGKVVSDLEVQFKRVILANTTITPLHRSCDVQLQPGPGPTVNRALRDQDRRYLSTVIQLSMLAWMHDRTELSSSLADCMRRRLEMNVPGANPDPGFEGVFTTLEACSSQTSAFAWNLYSQQVRTVLWQSYPPLEHPNLYRRDSIERLTPNILLAAMDYLYLVQSLPEDRKMVLQNQEGMIPLIVWAHYILGLTVQVHHPAENGVTFGTGTPQVIIQLSLKGVKPHGTVEILLLDRDMNVVLKCAPEDILTTEIKTQERHLLCGYGTEHFRRKFNQCLNTADNDPLYQETAQLILAFAIVKSSTLCRVAVSNPDRKPGDDLPCFSSLERWRIFDAADIIFHGIQYDRLEVDSYIRMIKNSTLQETSFPNSIEQYLQKWTEANGVDDAEDRKLKLSWNRRSLELLMGNLATLTLVFAHVPEVKDCNELPLAFDIDGLLERSTIFNQLFDGESIRLKESTIFYHIAGLLVGSRFSSSAYKKCFLVSDFGWSTFLSSCEDGSPAKVRPELVHVRRGVPTNGKTGERKSRIEDSPTTISCLPDTTVLDRGEEYVPRCAMGIKTRTEYFTSRSREFLLSIRFEIDHQYQATLQSADAYTSYRKLHRSLWMVQSSNHYKRCMHSRQFLARAKLGFGVATAKGYGWALEGREQGNPKVSERICICLVAEDQRARWLAIEDASDSTVRKAILRSDGCCENCALDSIASLPGKWLLVL
jgi:hypothetical protein